MTFRTKLLIISSLTVAGAVALVTGAVLASARGAFERLDGQRRSALLAQFESEMKAQGAEVVRGVDLAAASEPVARIAAEASRAEPDFASFYASAQELAQSLSLDYLDITRHDLTILSSAHWPARFGYPNDWAACGDCKQRDAFLVRVPMPDGTSAVALAAVREAKDAFVIGARRLDPAFLRTLGRAPGMRAVLWLSPSEVFDSRRKVAHPETLAGLVKDAERNGRQAARVGDEAFLAVPLRAGNRTMGVLLAGSSLSEQIELERSILKIGLWVGASGILLGVLLGWWTTERVTRPVKQLAEGARRVAGGDWATRVAEPSTDEIGELARAFNRMTAQLIEQRDRALQAERVAAWRELARRLAHELKNPLFPLQITIENLQKARAAKPAEFDEIFRESTATLLDELQNLKTIVGRFSDFAKMPAPRFERVDVNEIVRSVLRLHGPRFDAQGKIRVETELAEGELAIEADPDQLRGALNNLVLNAMDAMPAGGALRIRTARGAGSVRVEVSDTGAGLTEEERERLFTPYYTTKRHGTGLGLAIVQSVVSDHQGKIAVESQPGRGAKFVMDLPERRD